MKSRLHGRAAIVTLLVLVAGAMAVWVLLPRAPSPILSSVAVSIPADGNTTLVADARTGHAFIADDGTVQMLDLRTGVLLRTIRTAVAPAGRGALAATPTVVTHIPMPMIVDTPARLLFVVSPAGDTLSAFDTRTGALLRTTLVDQAPGDVAVDTRSGHVVVASAGSASVVDAATGALVGAPLRLPLGQGNARGALAVDTATAHGFVASPPFLEMFDTRSGALLRTIAIPGGIGTVVDDAPAGRVLVTNPANDTVTILDARSGESLGAIPVGAPPTTIAVDERTGRAFVAAGNGTVSTLDAQGGRLAHTATLPPTVARTQLSGVDARRGRVFAAAVHGLGVLDAHSGTALCILAVDQPIVAMAIDERAGHVLLIGAASTVTYRDQWAWVPQPVRRWLPFLPPPGPRTVTTPPRVSVLDEARLCR